MSRLRQILPPLAVIVVLLAAWEAAAQWDVLADAFTIRDFLIPAPSDVASALWEFRGVLWEDARRDVQRGRARLRASPLVLGVAFAIALHLSPTLRRAFYPLIVASQTIPPVAIAPCWSSGSASGSRRSCS